MKNHYKKTTTTTTKNTTKNKCLFTDFYNGSKHTWNFMPASRQTTRQWPQLQISYSIYRFCKWNLPIQETWTWGCLYVYIPLKALRGKKMLIYHWQWKGSLPQPYAVRHVGTVQERWLTFLITNPHALFCEAWANRNSRKKSNPIPANSRCPGPS